METMPHKRVILIMAAFGIVAGLVVFGSPALSQTAPSFVLKFSPELPIAGERITITAAPLNFAATSTVFSWFRDGIPLPSSSGLGRDTTSILTDPNQSEAIQIKVVVNPGPEFGLQEGTIPIYTLPSQIQQEETIHNITSDFALEASDINPSPGDNVEIRVTTFAFDKNNADYRWHINGAFQKDSSGRGRTRFQIQSGPEGSVKTVRVDVTTLSGESQSKSITIQSVSVPLYWWADTTAPYWYKGKALPSLNSRISVIALASLKNPNQFSYQWKFNDGIIPTASGFGKSTFSFNASFAIEEEIGVTIKDIAGSFLKTKTIGIGPVSPSVDIYEIRPLRGVVYEKHLTDFNAPSGDSYNFLAVPFFFPKEQEKNLKYVWQLNTQSITGVFTEPWLFTLKSNAGEESFNRVGVEVAGTAKGGEKSFASFTANFK